jgi:hypothetical protein
MEPPNSDLTGHHPPPPLPYQSPTTPTPPTPRAIYVRRAVHIMAALWPIVAMMAGVASDRVRIPLPKKIAISASAAIILALLFCVPTKHGWIVAFACFATLEVCVMWFWN